MHRRADPQRPIADGGRTVVGVGPAEGERADTLFGDENNDSMFGDDGTDMMYGNAGNDFMRGGSENDTMQGNANDDEMYGDSGNDVMYGNENNDTMRGNTGDDYMEGNGGSDLMYGGLGQDDMIGGSSELFGLPEEAMRRAAQQVHFHKPNPDQMLVGVDPGRTKGGHVFATENLLFLVRQLQSQFVCKVLPLGLPPAAGEIDIESLGPARIFSGKRPPLHL